ncbi:hypothetical protein [Wolbachia pipientis]|nr:hypothetical protein [Wolbachia pipientis]
MIIEHEQPAKGFLITKNVDALETKKLLDNLRRYPYHSSEAIHLTSQSAD